MLNRTQNFEHELKQQTEHFLMYPSSHVWSGIANNLRLNNNMPNKRRYTFLVFAIFIAGIANFYKHNNSVQNSTLVKNENNVVGKNGNLENEPMNAIVSYNNLALLTDNIKLEVVNNEPKKAIKEDVAEISKPNTALNKAIEAGVLSFKEIENAAKAIYKTDQILEPAINDIAIEETATNEVVSKVLPIIMQENLNSERKHETLLPIISKAKKDADMQNALPKKTQKQNHINIYFTPTMSQARITNKDAYGDINYVNKYNNPEPTVGFDLGAQWEYKIGEANILAGLQLNVYGNKFSAYYAANGFEPILNSTLTGANVQVIAPLSNLKTVGPKENETILKNSYVNVSAPIGINFNLLKIAKNINIYGLLMAAPTYQLRANHYAMTPNLKYYIQTPEPLRKWNVNALGSAYIEIKTKSLSWQVGPQVKYQLLSTYKKDFYIKETTKAVGLRIGVVKRF